MNTSATTTKTETKVNAPTFPVYVGKDDVITYYDVKEAKDPATFIGLLISNHKEKFSFYADFPEKKQLVKIPAAAGGKGEKERAMKALLSLAETACKGLERDEIPTDKSSLSVLDSIRNKGIKFSFYSFASVKKAISDKMANFTQKVKLHEDMTRAIPENKAMIEQTSLIRDVRKIVKENGNLAAIEYVNKQKAAKLLPGMVK